MRWPPVQSIGHNAQGLQLTGGLTGGALLAVLIQATALVMAARAWGAYTPQAGKAVEVRWNGMTRPKVASTIADPSGEVALLEIRPRQVRAS